jgi:hypothetical protein
MDENKILEKIEEQGKKIDEIYVSVEKTRKYFLWTLIVTVAAIVVPIIILIILIPWLMGIFGSAYGGLL